MALNYNAGVSAEIDDLTRRLIFSDRALCALLRAAENAQMKRTLLNCIDVDQAGVTVAEIEEWWKIEKPKDDLRRQSLAQMRKRVEEETRANALAKLTPEERRILGV